MGGNRLPILAAEIKRLHGECWQLVEASVARAIQAGEFLVEAKQQLRHGAWLPWLQEHCGMSQRTAASVTSATAAFDPANSPTEALFDWSDEFTGDPENTWIVMHPFRAARLYGAARPDIGARGGTWGGFPVLTSSSVPEESFFLIDPEQIAVAMGGAEIKASQNATVELADSTTQSSTATVTATNVTSMFQTDSTAILGEVSANWRVIRPGAVLTFNFQSYGL